MVFNSIHFLVFFPIVLIMYFLMPHKYRYIWILLSSYYFYMSWNIKYALLLLLSTGITYITGLGIDYVNKCMKPRYKKFSSKLYLIICLIINLSILGVFKYANFLIENIASFLGIFGIQFVARKIDFLLPVGISFYTFQALGYVIDVYKGTVQAERNFFRYALYVSFFPQLVAGPIEKSTVLLPQLNYLEQVNLWDYERIKKGFLIMWGGVFPKAYYCRQNINSRKYSLRELYKLWYRRNCHCNYTFCFSNIL